MKSKLSFLVLSLVLFSQSLYLQVLADEAMPVATAKPAADYDQEIKDRIAQTHAELSRCRLNGELTGQDGHAFDQRLSAIETKYGAATRRRGRLSVGDAWRLNRMLDLLTYKVFVTAGATASAFPAQPEKKRSGIELAKTRYPHERRRG